jgi:hypothetical protein
MYVPYKTLVQMLKDAYDEGRCSSLDMRNQIIEEIVDKHKVSTIQDFRVYSVEEMRNFPAGSKFCHSVLGNCEIIQQKGLRNCIMKFENGITHAFSVNGFPWDMPMIYMGEPLEQEI